MRGENVEIIGKAPRILLSEGSSLTAREAVTALGLAGFRVELVSSDPLCLARFSRFVRHVHPAPPARSDPDGYLAAVLDVVARRSIDVLMPVHEQAYLFAAARNHLPKGLGLALADFAAFERVQSKAALAKLLELMDAASQRGRRGDILRELTLLARAAGRYRDSIEELVPLAIDPFCILPLGFVLGKLLMSPASASDMSRHTIESYSLTPVAIERLRKWI
jgi:hypothetical protein